METKTKKSLRFVIQFDETLEHLYGQYVLDNWWDYVDFNRLYRRCMFMFVPSDISKDELVEFDSIEHAISCFDEMVSQGHWARYKIEQVFIFDDEHKCFYDFSTNADGTYQLILTDEIYTGESR